MTAAAVWDAIARTGVVPVVEVADVDAGVRLADALGAGGVDVVEVTFRTSAAADAIAAIARERPDMVVGAGTLLDADSVATAVAAGAAFGVSPGFDERLVRRARSGGLPYAPGVSTPSELQAAVVIGCQLVKLFPASLSSPAGLAAIVAPFASRGVRLLPTGGIDEQSAADYLRNRQVAAVGGTWIAPRADIAAGRWDAITARAQRARELVARVRDAVVAEAVV